MGNSRSRWLEAAALASSDAAALVLAGSAAYAASLGVNWAVGGDEFVAPLRAAGERWATFAGVACLLVLWLASRGHYRWRSPFWIEARQVAQGCAVALLAEGFLHFAAKGEFSRLLTVLTWMAAPVAIMAVRRGAKAALARLGVGRERVVVFGSGEDADRAAALVRSDPSLGYDLAAVSGETDPDAAAREMSSLGASLAVVAMSGTGGCAGAALARGLSASGIPMAIVPALSGIPVAGMRAQYVLGMDGVMLVDRANLAPWLSRAGKRAFDVAVAGTLALAAAVPLLAVMALVSLDGGSPVFAHRRVGRGGREFPCLKVRTMRQDAAEVLARLLETDPEAAREWQETRKLRRDPRVTRLGSLLRKTAVDELPQLLNVLAGHMSLVGPRPVTDGELGRYGAASTLYLAVRPGVTGLWQVSGRSDLSYEERVALDAWYVRNWSAWHDVAILSKTVPAMLSRRGAY